MKLFEGQSLFTWLGKKISGTKVTERALLDVSNQLYIKELALYTAVGLLADLLASCEIQTFRGDIPVRDGNWYRLNVAPNHNQSGADLKAQLVTNLYYQGKALVVPLSGQLYVANSFQREEYPLLGDRFVNITIGTLQIQKQFRATDVYYLTQGDRSVRRLVDGMFVGYGELMAAVADASKRSGGEKYVLDLGRLPSGTPTEQQDYLDLVQKNLQSFVAASSAAYPLTKDQKLTRLSGSTGGSVNDMMGLRKDVYSIVASALHLPEGLLSGNMTNVEQITNQALTFALDPLAQRISTEITRKTYTQDQILYGGCRARVDTSYIGHVDMVTMAEKLDKLISSGICCIDEVRRRCNLPELNTDWSQRHYLTKNYDSVAAMLDPLEEGGNVNGI